MINVFLSYSLNDQDEYILSLLADELQNKGCSIYQSSDFNEVLSPLTTNNINNSQLVIGLVTGKSVERQRIMNEWEVALNSKIPTLLIVEDIVPIAPNFNHPLITFSRNNPEKAINKLKDEMNKMESKKEGGSNVAAWLIGGAAILGLISLLSGDSKK
ncbi:MAG: TIR domain-containing protein [Flavobacteriaceae bacterium]